MNCLNGFVETEKVTDDPQGFNDFQRKYFIRNKKAQSNLNHLITTAL